MEHNSMKRLEKIGKYVVLILWGGIILYLTVLSFLGTSAEAKRNIAAEGEIPQYSPQIYYLPDNPWKHILFLVVFTLICLGTKYVLCKREAKTNRTISDRTWLLGGMISFLLIGTFYVFCTQFRPGSDPAKLQLVASEMMQGNFGQFLEGEYMHRYPFQSGFLLVVYYVMKLFGETEFVVMQFLNVLAVAIACYYIYKSVQLIFHKNIRLGWLAEISFVPILLYTSFVYGNLLSFAAAMAAVYFEFSFFDNEKMSHAVFSAILISLAVILKSNSLIIFCAMSIYALCKLVFKTNRIKVSLYIFMLIAFYIIGNKVVESWTENITGIQMSKGMPKIAWAAMGLEDGGMAPGYWTGSSVALYTENNYDYAKTSDAAMRVIEERIQYYLDDWREGLNFFGRKIAAQWNEPTFQGIMISEGRPSERQIPGWIVSMIEGTGRIYLSEALNIFQTWVYFGALLYVIFFFKKCSLDELIFAVIMMGGFIFHLVWEGKSQYVMLYFFCLIPYAVFGYQALVNLLWNFNYRNISKKKIKSICVGVALAVAIAVPIGMHVKSMKTFRYTLGVRSSEELLTEYSEIQNKIR